MPAEDGGHTYRRLADMVPVSKDGVLVFLAIFASVAFLVLFFASALAGILS